MNKKRNMSLKAYENIFKSEKHQNSDEIVNLHISKLKPYEDQPFKVIEDASLYELAESIKQYGVLNPIIVRSSGDNNYEIISGHRRVRASSMAGKEYVPSVIYNLTDDEAIIMLVDSNLYREKILPSEKAYAYKLKVEALKRQGMRADLTSSQIGTKLRADEKVALEVGESRNQVQRYIRLTELVFQLLEHVDKENIPLNAAVELSYLGSKAQSDVADILESEQINVSIKQAKKLREISKDGKIERHKIENILLESIPQKINITLGEKKLRKYFPKEYSKKQIENILMELIKKWYEENGKERT